MESDAALTEMIATRVALGVDPFETVVERAVEFLEADIEEDTDVVQRVWRLTDELFAQHLAAQETWPAVTDSDRMTRAFRDLDLATIVAREVFTCCQNCGHAEIRDEYSPGQYPRGYVFYHEQDAHRGVAGEGIYLAFDGDIQKTVGREVVAALKARGLRPQWNGSTGTRILVPMTWQRRRLGRLAAHPGTIAEDDFTVTAEPLDGWAGPPITAMATSAKAWAALRLPWLPAVRSVRITDEAGETVVLQREWDRLLATYGDGDKAEASTANAWALLTGVPASADEPEPMLEVSYDFSGRATDGIIPMTLNESLALLPAMPIRTGHWATYTGRSREVIQHVWEDGPKLWLEVLDPKHHCSHGRHVTIDEAQRVIRILAEEDRVVMAPLGKLQTRYW